MPLPPAAADGALARAHAPDAHTNLVNIVLIIVDSQGHIPNQLQDLLLQTFGGLLLASELDHAMHIFWNCGSWPDMLVNLPVATQGRHEPAEQRHPTSVNGLTAAYPGPSAQPSGPSTQPSARCPNVNVFFSSNASILAKP